MFERENGINGIIDKKIGEDSALSCNIKVSVKSLQEGTRV